MGVTDSSIRSRLLREGKFTLQKALDICRSSEVAAQHQLLIQSVSAVVDTAHFIKGKKAQHKAKDGDKKSQSDKCIIILWSNTQQG